MLALLKMCRYILIFIFSILLQNAFCNLRVDPIVNTRLGVIKGLRADDGDYSMYMGIPYGQVDLSNPFGEALPAPAFEGDFEAYDDTSSCPQRDQATRLLRGSLDCLHVNVYVPDTANSTNPLAVLVWIYGGGFSVGYGGRYLYGPSFLVRHDIILVTLNYRLGAYGFMCLDSPDVPGNTGLKDQNLALRWVKNNIDSFGGNPEKITVFGQSAGSMSVDLQIMTPQDENLFSQVIMHSGTMHTPTFNEPFRNAPLLMAEHLGFRTDNINDALSFLATEDPYDVLLAVEATRVQFKPCVEKEYQNVNNFITRNWITSDVPKVKNMPVLIGITSHEKMTTYYNQGPEYYATTNPFYNILQVAFDVDNEEFAGMEEMARRFYIGDEIPSEAVKWDIIDFESDFRFVHATHRTINKFIENEAGNIYYFMLSYSGGRNYAKINANLTHVPGAAHQDDIGYVFDVSYMDRNMTSEDQLIVDRMTTMIANFVKYGDPTPEVSELFPIKWTPITKGSPHYYLNIDTEVTEKMRPYTMRMTFWDLFYRLNWNMHWLYSSDRVVSGSSIASPMISLLVISLMTLYS